MNADSTTCRSWLLVLALSIAATLAAAGAEIPSSPVGEALDRWLAVAQSPDEQPAREHYQRHFTSAFQAQVPEDAYIGFLGQVRQLMAGKGLTRIDVQDDYALIGWIEGTAAGWLELRIQVEGDEPHRIEGLQIRPGSPPEESAAAEPQPSAGRTAGESDSPSHQWDRLADLVSEVRAEHGFPALAAAWVRSGKIVDLAVVGVREVGTDNNAESTDLFHIGSVTKSMTATMIARLIEKGTLDWDTTLGDVLEDVEMHDAYRQVTVAQLLRHRGGIVEHLTFDDAEMARLVGLPGNPTEQRAAYVREVLRLEPMAQPGGATHYSNAGYAVAGYIAERATGKSWEELLRIHVFKPLKMESAGFGWPATPERPDQPRGHYENEGSFTAQSLDGDYELGAFVDPAGDVHVSIEDLARYAAFHVAGLRGVDGVLTANTVRQLHTPPDGDNYACGWIVTDKTKDGTWLHFHNGSAGTFYAVVALFPETDQAMVVATNSGFGAQDAAMEIVRSIFRKQAENGAGG